MEKRGLYYYLTKSGSGNMQDSPVQEDEQKRGHRNGHINVRPATQKTGHTRQENHAHRPELFKHCTNDRFVLSTGYIRNYIRDRERGVSYGVFNTYTLASHLQITAPAVYIRPQQTADMHLSGRRQSVNPRFHEPNSSAIYHPLT